MNTPFLIGIVIILNAELANAQSWTKEDSLRLRDILSGKEKIRLKPEFQKAIEAGTLLVPEKTSTPMRQAPLKLPISNDFSEYIKPSDVFSSDKSDEFKDLPPAVMMRYNLGKTYDFDEVNPNAYIFGGGLRTFSSSYKSNFGVSVSFSADELLRTAFSRTYRQIQHNKKHANAWKNYNSVPSLEMQLKQRIFRMENPHVAIPLNHNDSIKLKERREKDRILIGPPRPSY